MELLTWRAGMRQKIPHDPEGEKLMKSDQYVHGFAAGAIHIWKQVAKKLRNAY